MKSQYAQTSCLLQAAPGRRPFEANLDPQVVDGFGEEWSRFDQADLPEQDHRDIFQAYFANFPWHLLPANAMGFDLGCGSGRWAKQVAPRVGELHCIDASAAALETAKRNLKRQSNCRFHLASADAIPLDDGSADFGFSLGVLHHLPDTQAGLSACVQKLKPGAPFLVYLYYAFDNRPLWFRLLWQCSELGRYLISRSPHRLRQSICEVIALSVYWPLARTARVLEKLGVGVDSWPLSSYRKRSFYVMRTDALDRFGTRLEQRFGRQTIQEMMSQAGLTEIQFNEGPPYWCAVGLKK